MLEVVIMEAMMYLYLELQLYIVPVRDVRES